ncbi:MAG: hypothetical protein QM736_01705 [Vicinamibacterales bacterium]
MCGIAGGLFWGGGVDASRARAAVDAMVSTLAHRGPDGHGIYVSPTDAGARAPFAVLGHTRLAIIDLSADGAQPMGLGHGGPWVTFNGEIYNYAALRSELEKSATFHSHSDTETLLHGYDQWDRGVLARLRGMFACAIWDPRRERLLLARDRLGIKPLYIHQGDGFFLFASEVRALLASGLVPRQINLTSLWQ